MLRLLFLAGALLLIVVTTNQTVSYSATAPLETEQISSECLSCHEDVNDPNGHSHSVSHVIGIAYVDYVAGDENLRPVSDLPSELVLFDGVVTCATCHGSDPHDGQSLVINNRESGLCRACNLK